MPMPAPVALARLAARGFGIVGIVIATLEIVATVFGGAAGQMFG